MFLLTQSGDLFAGGGFSREGYIEIFVAYLVTSSRVELPVTKNTQTNFSKFMFLVVWRLTLVTCSRLDSIAKITCFAQIGQFLNFFSFSVKLLCLFIVFPLSTLSQTLRVTLISLHFCFISTSNLQEKGMVFLFLATYFLF